MAYSRCGPLTVRLRDYSKPVTARLAPSCIVPGVARPRYVLSTTQGLPLLRYHLRVRRWLRLPCSLLIFSYARLKLCSGRDIVHVARRHQDHGKAKAVSKGRDARFIITLSIFVSAHGS